MDLSHCLKRFTFRPIVLFLVLLSFSTSAVFAQDAPAADAVDPQALAEGRTLFNNNCAQCHSLTNQVVVGPGLQGLLERRPVEWLIPWIRNSQQVIQSGDEYAVQIFNKFNQTLMPAYPNFSDAQIQNILAYIQTSSQQGTGMEPTPGDGTPPTETANGAGGGGISSQYFTIILGALLVILLLVLLVLIMIVSLLSKFLAQRKDLTDEDREQLEQKTDVKKIVNSPAFKGGVTILFLLVIGKVVLDNLMYVGIHQGYAPTQPIAFSHKLHAGQYQIDCAYCHTSVYKSSSANIPSANICMNCHNSIKQASPEIQKIYTAIETETPIEWIRVHNLPDLAYFNHSQHTNVGGIQCQSCHGEIQQMEVVQQVSTLTMGWCIDCHRNTAVNTKGNAYYDKLLAVHNSKEPLKVANIGGLECSKCHY